MNIPDPLAAKTITVITSHHPVNKRYMLQPDGSLTKNAAASIRRGTAQSYIVDTHDKMMAVVSEVTRSDDKCIVPGRWHGDDGTPFEIVTKAVLARMHGVAEDDCPTGIVSYKGHGVAARYAHGIDPSSWFLFDADNPRGIPPEWAGMSLEERLAAWESFAKGISKVRGVGLRASSARVRKADAPARDWSHLWVKLDYPSRGPLLRVHCTIEMGCHGWSFASPRHSRVEPGRVIGYDTRGLFDLSVWHTGRIVFVAQPDVSAAPGYVVDGADVGIIEGDEVFDTSFAKMPDGAAKAAYSQKTGAAADFKISAAGAISTTSRGELTLDTEIEVKGVVNPLRDWIASMKPGDKRRCEAPFRDLSSEAAFIRIGDDGQPFVHDSGNSTTYRLTAPGDAIVAEFNARYMVVNEAGRTVVYEPVHDPLLGRRVYVTSTFEDFKKLHLNRMVAVGHNSKGEPKWMDAGTYWLKHRDRKQYLGGVVFDPSGMADRPDVLNLWQGFAVDARPGGSWAKLRDHILTIICDGNREHYDYLMGWLARLVQHPARQGEVAVVLRGGEGTGKGTLANAVRRLFGPHGLAISNSEHLVGRFNGHLRDLVFLFADEAFYAGNKAHIGALKSLITEQRLPIEAKYKNPIEATNFIHLMMASNEEWVIPAAVDSRRFFVLDVSPARVNDYGYFAAIWEEQEHGGYEAMLHDLLNHDLTGFNVRRVPQTAALNEQRLLSLDAHTAWWHGVLHEGRVGPYDPEWGEFETTERLYDSYAAHARNRHEFRLLDKAQLGKFLRKMGGQRTRPHGQRRGYNFGPLAKAREVFCRKTGVKIDWPD